MNAAETATEVHRIGATALVGEDPGPDLDWVAVERPMTVHVAGRDDEPRVLATTMRTPGDDIALAIGLCLADGVLARPGQLVDARRCPDALDEGPSIPAHDSGGLDDVLVVIEQPSVDLSGLARRGVMTSSCGICGRTLMDDVARRSRVAIPCRDMVGSDVLFSLPAALRARQAVFGSTGGLHAVATFDLEGGLLDVREDVGRHNAFDKVVGRAVLGDQLPMDDRIVLLSGRASYELIAKAAVAGAGIVVAIGAPSSMAVDLAQQCGITLVGFLRDGRGNVYTHPGRVVGVGAGNLSSLEA